MEDFLKKYGFIAIAGFVGAIIKRFRKKMSVLKFLATIGISVFVSVISGIFIREWTSLPEEVIFGICGIIGVFSDELLDEVKEFIQGLSDIAKEWISKQKNKNTE